MRENPQSIDVGVNKGSPFCMAFLFAKDGLKVYSGSIDRIESATSTMPVCHGIVHIYCKISNMRKYWSLFGNRRGLELLKLSWRKNDRRFSGRYVKKNHKYILYSGEVDDYYGFEPRPLKEFKLIASWRRLPSEFLNELEPYQ